MILILGDERTLVGFWEGRMIYQIYTILIKIIQYLNDPLINSITFIPNGFRIMQLKQSLEPSGHEIVSNQFLRNIMRNRHSKLNLQPQKQGVKLNIKVDTLRHFVIFKNRHRYKDKEF